MNHLSRLTAYLILCLCITSVSAQTLDQDLNQALSKLDQGILLLEQHDPQGHSVLQEASALIENAISNHDFHTPAIYHALGNAYMLSDDLGHAIIAYRKGEQLDPTNIQLRESLQHARSIVPVSLESSITNRAWSFLLSWRGYIPRFFLWGLFVFTFSAGWILFAHSLIRSPAHKRRSISLWLILASLMPLGMLGTEWYQFQNTHWVVIIGKNIQARSGPDDKIYDPVFNNQLQGGLEGKLVESRNNWHHILLSNGTHCWIPSENAKIVSQS